MKLEDEFLSWARVREYLKKRAKHNQILSPEERELVMDYLARDAADGWDCYSSSDMVDMAYNGYMGICYCQDEELIEDLKLLSEDNLEYLPEQIRRIMVSYEAEKAILSR